MQISQSQMIDIDPIKRTIVTEASNIGPEFYGQPKITFVSNLETQTDFFLDDTRRDDEGDVTAWVYRPAKHTWRAFEGWVLTVFND